MSIPNWDRHAPVIPFIEDVMQGSVYRWNADKVEWRSVPVRFKTAMKITGYEATNASYAVRLQGQDGNNYRMPVTDLFDILERSVVDHDQIPPLEYRFNKQGMTYIIKVVWEEDEDA